jgi:hypothetical protein
VELDFQTGALLILIAAVVAMLVGGFASFAASSCKA